MKIIGFLAYCQCIAYLVSLSQRDLTLEVGYGQYGFIRCRTSLDKIAVVTSLDIF